MKVAVVGGGSTYTPELVDGFARLRELLPIEELWLVDPDDSRLELVSGLSRRIFAKALRTVPVVLDIADIVREKAKPNAWIIDFTNPVGIVTRALLEAGHRAVGLCNVAIGFQRRFAALLGADPNDVSGG